VTAPALAKHGVEGVLTPSTQGTEAAPAGASLPRVAESLLEGGFKAVSGATPLEVAARMVQEDLILLRASDGGDYRAVAASVCFSFGDLPKRIGDAHSMAQLHAKVDNYDRDLSNPVSRMMAALKHTKPIWRTNWGLSFCGSLHPTPDRYALNLEKRRRVFPNAAETMWDGVDGCVRRIQEHGCGQAMFVKTEYQTLRRLYRNPDYVLFTVRTHVDPLSKLQGLPRAAALLADNLRLASQIDFRKYKGIDDPRILRLLLEYLQTIQADSA